MTRHMAPRPRRRGADCAQVRAWIAQLDAGVRIKDEEFARVLGHIVLCAACLEAYARLRPSGQLEVND